MMEKIINIVQNVVSFLPRRRPFSELTPYGQYRENKLHPHCRYCGYPVPSEKAYHGANYCCRAHNDLAYRLHKKGTECTAHMTARKGDFLWVPKRKVGRYT